MSLTVAVILAVLLVIIAVQAGGWLGRRAARGEEPERGPMRGDDLTDWPPLENPPA